MRFALGSVGELNDYMGNVNMGKVAQIGTEIDSALENYGTRLQGQIGATGILSKANARTGKILRDASSAAANDSLFGTIANTALSIGGGALKSGMFSSDTPITSAYEGLGGFGPVANGDAYGGFLDATKGTTGIGPFASGDAYGSFLRRR